MEIVHGLKAEAGMQTKTEAKAEAKAESRVYRFLYKVNTLTAYQAGPRGQTPAEDEWPQPACPGGDGTQVIEPR